LTRESASAWKQAFEKATKRRERVVNDESRKSSEIEIVTGETEDVASSLEEERPKKKARK